MPEQKEDESLFINHLFYIYSFNNINVAKPNKILKNFCLTIRRY